MRGLTLTATQRNDDGGSCNNAVCVLREMNEDSECYLVDPASSHMLVSKIKPCRSKSMPQ